MDTKGSNFSSVSTSAGGNCFLSLKNGGMLSSMLSLESKSLTVNPLSAIMEMPGLYSNFSKNPLNLVNSTSDTDPTKTGDIKQIAPLGLQATRNLTVLWCLYYDHVDDCMNKSDGVSMNTSLPSIIAKVVGNFSLNAEGSVAQTWSTLGIQSISFK